MGIEPGENFKVFRGMTTPLTGAITNILLDERCSNNGLFSRKRHLGHSHHQRKKKEFYENTPLPPLRTCLQQRGRGQSGTPHSSFIVLSAMSGSLTKKHLTPP
jgi:hypothetical protein